MPNLAVERSDAGTGSTPGLAQFRHPWAPPPGPKSDRVGAPGIARESVGFDSLTARGARWRSCALLHCWRPDCSIGHIFLPGAEQGGVRIETADRRYEVRTLDDGVVHIEEPHILPFYRCNIRLVHGRLRSLPVDSRHRRAPCAGSAYRRAGIGPGARGRAGRLGRCSPRAWRARVAGRQVTMRPKRCYVGRLAMLVEGCGAIPHPARQ